MKLPLRREQLAALAALLGVALTLSAAYWQFQRAAEKERLRAEFETRRAAPELVIPGPLPPLEAVRFRRVRATGVLLADRMIYLDNRVRDGVAGYEVIVPLRLAGGGRSILVNRGWVARAALRTDLPRVPLPGGTVTLSGMAVVPPERVFELAAQTVEGRIWQNLVLDRYRALIGLDVADFVIQQESEAADGLLRRWEAPRFGAERHRSYAYQWLFFAALIVIFWRIHRR
jgi:surfeit locus 1 family protein